MKADAIIKWAGTITTAAGVALTAFDVTPANKMVGILGSICWGWAGWRMREPSLWLLNAFFILMYALGFYLNNLTH
jgi:hypothetical protein